MRTTSADILHRRRSRGARNTPILNSRSISVGLFAQPLFAMHGLCWKCQFMCGCGYCREGYYYHGWELELAMQVLSCGYVAIVWDRYYLYYAYCQLHHDRDDDEDDDDATATANATTAATLPLPLCSTTTTTAKTTTATAATSYCFCCSTCCYFYYRDYSCYCCCCCCSCPYCSSSRSGYCCCYLCRRRFCRNFYCQCQLLLSPRRQAEPTSASTTTTYSILSVFGDVWCHGGGGELQVYMAKSFADLTWTMACS